LGEVQEKIQRHLGKKNHENRGALVKKKIWNADRGGGEFVLKGKKPEKECKVQRDSKNPATRPVKKAKNLDILEGPV